MRILPLVALLLLALPATVGAAQYFEFNPDYSQSMLLASTQTTAQIFLPLNEHMSGIDFWFSNAQTGGDVTLTLLSPSGGQLAQRTVSVPPVADDPGGQRIHINWPAQLATQGGQPYSVRIGTASPTMRMWYGQTNRIVPHNAPPAGVFSSGAMEIDGEIRSDSVKFALHENNETTPPTITNVAVAQPATGQAILTFNANEPVDGHADYNTQTTPYSGQYSPCIEQVSQCTVHLAVTPGIVYDYILTVRDVWGNEASVPGQFTALGEAPPSVTPTPSASAGTSPTPPPDTTAPVITNLRAVNITSTGAAIVWTTDEAANGLAVVQLLPFLITVGGGSDATFELEHLIPVQGLDPSSAYFVRVMSSDGAGNTAIATRSFQTLPASTPSPGATPTPSMSPTPTPAPSANVDPGTGGEPTVSWDPPAQEPSDGYRIDIIGPDGKLIRTIRTRDRSAALGEVPEGSTVLIYADNGGIYEKVAAPTTVGKSGSGMDRLLGLLPWILVGLAAVIGGVIGIIKLRARRTPPPTPQEPPKPLSGAQPNPPAF